MNLTYMNPQTARLAIQLQLGDINDVLGNIHQAQDSLTKATRNVFRLLRRELQDKLQILDTQVLCLKMLTEERENRIAFTRLVQQEDQAAEDHRLARQLAGLSVTEPAKKGPKKRRNAHFHASADEQWEAAKGLYAAAFPAEADLPLAVAQRAPLHGVRTATSKQAKRMTTTALPEKTPATCCSCMEQVLQNNTLTLQCKPEAHTYCRECLVSLFTSAIADTTLFPPRCCKVPIPLDICRTLLPKALVKEFDLKVEELATPNPTYCSNAKCARFLSVKDITAEIGRCNSCENKTCSRCKSPAHDGLCQQDPYVNLLMDLAKRGKWQQCTKCKNMVELAVGCFHMTCRCRHQFCYLCGLRWKTCLCPRWQEDYLTQNVPVVPAPQPAAPPALPHVHDWQRVNGPDCGDCGADYLPYVMRCMGCNTSSCWRCIHNRE